MRLAKCGAQPAAFALRTHNFLWLGLNSLGLDLRLDRLALHDQCNCPNDGLILTISDVISHGLLHEVPSSLVPETKVVLDRPRLSGANGTEFQIRAIEISGLACSGRPG